MPPQDTVEALPELLPPVQGALLDLLALVLAGRTFRKDVTTGYRQQLMSAISSGFEPLLVAFVGWQHQFCEGVGSLTPHRHCMRRKHRPAKQSCLVCSARSATHSTHSQNDRPARQPSKPFSLVARRVAWGAADAAGAGNSRRLQLWTGAAAALCGRARAALPR